MTPTTVKMSQSSLVGVNTIGDNRRVNFILTGIKNVSSMQSD